MRKTVDAASREVTLPLHTQLTESDVDTICDAVLQEIGISSSELKGLLEY